MPLSSTSISDRKRRKPHFYDSRLFIYIFRFFSLASGCFWTFYCFSWLYVHFLLPGSVFSSGFRMFLDFFLLFLCFMSILTGSVPYYLLASGCFWTFLLLFSALCPFSPARFRISLWLPDVFGLFPAFSVLYVHFLLPGSVFPSGFRMILDFFTAFLDFMSIFSCPAPYFPLASGCFWTFSCFFCALCLFSPARLRISLWFPDVFGLFYCFSRPYVHFHLLSSVFLSSFTFILDFFPCFSLLYVHFHLLSSVFPSGFTFILDFFPVFLSFMSIWKNTEDSGPRKAALRRIKRSAITAFLFQKLLFRLP